MSENRSGGIDSSRWRITAIPCGASICNFGTACAIKNRVIRPHVASSLALRSPCPGARSCRLTLYTPWRFQLGAASFPVSLHTRRCSEWQPLATDTCSFASSTSISAAFIGGFTRYRYFLTITMATFCYRFSYNDFGTFDWRRTQVVRERSAKPLCIGSNPIGAS